jgi:uncharacterized protein (TIGR02246 family)
MLAVLAVLAVTACTLQVNPAREEGGGEEEADPEAEIVSMLRASAGSWNAGDLEAFLDDYSGGPDLTFVGASGIHRGLDEVRARYRRTYWAPGAERDSLRFEEMEVRVLGDEHALTLGRYVLYRPAAGDSVTATGRFSLVLERRDEGWKIIHDHSS